MACLICAKKTLCMCNQPKQLLQSVQMVHNRCNSCNYLYLVHFSNCVQSVQPPTVSINCTEEWCMLCVKSSILCAMCSMLCAMCGMLCPPMRAFLPDTLLLTAPITSSPNHHLHNHCNHHNTNQLKIINIALNCRSLHCNREHSAVFREHWDL